MAKGALNQIFDTGADMLRDIHKKGGSLLTSNSPIKAAYDDGFGLKQVKHAYKGRASNPNWMEEAWKKGYTMNDGKNLNLVNIAGTAAVGATAARAVSGGGITKDSNGNTNIVALPFI